MKKNKLLILPFLIGLVLVAYSWYLSFPISVNSIGGTVFSHVSILYWFSVPLLLTSMFLIAIKFKNIYVNWIMAAGFVIVLYSLRYFFYTMPTGDSAYFRGVTENFIRTNDLNASQFALSYYQWPSFFILAKITTLVSGLRLTIYEFLDYTIIGFLLSTALYVYSSKVYRRSGFLAVAAFFVVMFSYLNYQAAPFSTAFALLLILLMLETQEKSVGTLLAMFILYTSITFTHAYAPLFFVIYLLIQSIVSRKRQYFELFILALVIYLIVQTTFAVFSFKGHILMVFTSPSEIPGVVSTTVASTSAVVDAIPHLFSLFSRYVSIAFGVLCIAGFFFLIIKRKLRKMDIAIFLTGVVYTVLGVALFLLGYRAIPLVFVPVVLGIAFLFESKFRKYLKYLVVGLLIFVVSIQMNSSINSNPITFQTKEDLVTANFMIDKYDWNSSSAVIVDTNAKWYISAQIQGNTEIDYQYESRFGLSNIIKYDSIVYSIGLANSLNMSNISVEATSQRIIERFDVVYNSGLSYIAKKSS